MQPAHPHSGIGRLGGADPIPTAPPAPSLPDAARLRAAAGLPPATPEAGEVTCTFRAPGAEASLELRLTKDGAALRVGSIGALVIGAVGLALLLLRRGRRG